MATTPNYGFIMPDPTDFVTNLPADFEIFGDEVDSRIKALNPETTLGDISYRGSTANAKTRLGIGTTGQVLTVSGGVPAWATPASGGLTLLSTTSLSGSTVSVTGISSAYKDLVIEIVNPNDSVAFLMTAGFNSNTSDHYQIIAASPVTTDLFSRNASTILFRAGASSTNTNANTFIRMYVHNYAATTERKTFFYTSISVDANGTTYGSMSGGGFNLNNAISSFQLYTNGSGFNAGTLRIYGAN